MFSSSWASRSGIPRHLREIHGPVRRHDRLHPLLARLGRHERHDAVDQRFRLHRPQGRGDRPGEGEEPVRGLAEPVDLLDVQLEHPPLGHAFRDGVPQDLRGPLQGVERVLDLVGDPRRHLAQRPELPGADQLRLDPPLLREGVSQPGRQPLLPLPLAALPVDQQARHDRNDIIEDDLQALLQGVRGVLHQEAREGVGEVDQGGEHGNGDPAPHAAGERGEQDRQVVEPAEDVVPPRVVRPRPIVQDGDHETGDPRREHHPRREDRPQVLQQPLREAAPRAVRHRGEARISRSGRRGCAAGSAGTKPPA